MGRPESQIHDAGIHRSCERQYNRQAAHRGSLSVPAPPAGYRNGRQAFAQRVGTRPGGGNQMLHWLDRRRLTMAVIVMAALVGFSFTTGTTVAGTEEDVAKAENFINQIKMHMEADKRAFGRAIEALSQTTDGRKRLLECATMQEEARKALEELGSIVTTGH